MRIVVGIIVVILVAAIGTSVYLFFQLYERVEWQQPVAMNRVLYGEGPLHGTWRGETYLLHDCSGCETRNRYQLDIYDDSTAAVFVAVDTLQLVHLPVLDITYARAHLWQIEVADASIANSRIFNETDYANQGRLATGADTLFSAPFELRGDSLLLPTFSRSFF